MNRLGKHRKARLLDISHLFHPEPPAWYEYVGGAATLLLLCGATYVIVGYLFELIN